MEHRQKLVSKTKYGLPEMIFFGGTLLALIGGYNYFSYRAPISDRAVRNVGSPSVIERKLSIESALRNGQNTYQYQSRMIPGIGVISDPDAYLNKLEQEVKKNSAD